MQVDPSSQALMHALDVADLRHSLLADNLANLNTTGYARADVDFEAALKDETGSPQSHVQRQGAPNLVAETGDMAANDTFYMACARLLSMQYQNLRQSLK
jgi:flagellar basal body rod protein FlgB